MLFWPTSMLDFTGIAIDSMDNGLGGIVTLVGGVIQAQFSPFAPIGSQARGAPLRAGIALGIPSLDTRVNPAPFADTAGRSNAMRTRLFSTLLGAGIGLAVIAVLAHAADDIEVTAQLCAACHGQNGVPSDPKTVPIIWGQERSYLFKQMRNYRNGERDNPIMSPIAKSLAEEDLRKIASYFAAKSWPARSATATPAPPPKGNRAMPAMPSAEFSGWAAGAAPGRS